MPLQKGVQKKVLKFDRDPFKVLKKFKYTTFVLKKASETTSIYEAFKKGTRKGVKAKIFWRQKKIMIF